MSANAPADGGFTLIELLVVMAIATVIFLLVVPSGPRQRDRAELANSVRAVAAGLRMTRSHAIASDKPMVFIVDVESRRFTGAEGGVVGELPHGTSITLTTADDEIVSPSVGTIRFFPDGSSTGGGLAILRRPDRYDVLVDWLTGGVSIYERKATAR